MKIKTPKQLLITLILVTFFIFSLVGAVVYYLDGPQLLAPLFGTAAVIVAIQYNSRKKQLPGA